MQNEKPTETIRELAEKHLNDETHTTSDEELRNARIELSDGVPADSGLYEEQNTPVLPPIPGEPQILSDSDVERKPPNPYDVLGG